VAYYHRHHLASRNEARTGPHDVSRSGGDNTAARGAYTAEQADRKARAETNAEALENCTGLAPGVTNLPIDQIRQTVRPTADQEAALDNLSSARRKQAKSSNRRAQLRFRSHRSVA
jgi:hypothetical protein